MASKRTEISIPCTNCRNNTSHRIHRSFPVHTNYEESGIQIWDDYLIAQCLGCKSVSFVYESSCSEDCEINSTTGQSEIVVRRTLYPSRIEGRQTMPRLEAIPKKVLSIYRETYQAIGEKMPILAGVGIRAIIETITQEKEAVGYSLKNKIDSLASQGLITIDGSKILHNLRFLGNSAAHEAKAHTEEELLAALDVVEHLLNSVYILPNLAMKLPSNPSL